VLSAIKDADASLQRERAVVEKAMEAAAVEAAAHAAAGTQVAADLAMKEVEEFKRFYKGHRDRCSMAPVSATDKKVDEWMGALSAYDMKRADLSLANKMAKVQAKVSATAAKMQASLDGVANLTSMDAASQSEAALKQAGCTAAATLDPNSLRGRPLAR
jgi:hypothetical protein